MSRIPSMTRALILLTALAVALPVLAGRGDDTDRKSKNGVASFSLDGVEVTVEYGRPKVNGRTIWGQLVPYGKVWRTGADEATTITFSEDATIEGEPIAAGSYALFTTPGEGDWTFIFNKQAEQWGAFNHDPAQDALTVTATPSEAEHVEELTFEADGNTIVLRWATLAVGFTVAAAG